MRFGLLIGLCLLCFAAKAAEPFHLTEAQIKDFAVDPAWARLMHFHKKESTVDSKEFFIAPDGKTNLASELKATAELFNKDPSKACLFAGRYLWLKRKLGLSLPAPECPEYDKFRKEIGLTRVALIYTTSYLGNPASFFGHTLLRLDSQRDATLLSYALNYGAVTGNDTDILYAIKGLSGGYPGVFSVYPYYDTVNLYNNMENRDIWEYRLNMTQEESDLFIAHVWELGHNTAQYYFATENCSYMVMETLNLLRPETDWTEQLPFLFTLPADTVRIVLKQKGLAGDIVYRPSRQTKIRNAFAHLSDAERDALYKLIDDPNAAIDLPDESKAAVLETAYEYLQYRFIKKKVDLKTLRDSTIALLKARNALPAKSVLPPVPVPSVRPDQSHKPSAVTVSAGHGNHKNFVELTWRPVLHTLLDESDGFIPFNAINYLAGTARYDEDGKLSLRRLDIVDLMSPAPAEQLFHPVAFKVKFGFDRFFYSPSGKELPVFDVSGGAGGAVMIGKHIDAYLIMTATVKAGKRSVAGLGFEAGLAADFGKVRTTLSVRPEAMTRKDARLTVYDAGLSVSLSRDWSWVTAYSFQDGKKYDNKTITSGLQYRF